MNAPLRAILRNWSLLGSAQMIASLVAMATMIVVSRTLGDAEFGRLYLALTLAAIVGVVADAGLTPVVTRAIARDRAATRPYLVRAAAIVAMLGLTLYGALAAGTAAFGLAADLRVLVLVFGAFVLADAYAQVLTGVFAGHERMAVPAATRVFSNLLVFALIAIASHGSAVAVALVLMFGAVVRAVVQLAALGGLEGLRAAGGPPPAWRGLLRAGAPFAASQGLGLFVVRVDVLILAYVASDAAVGWYGAATRLTEALNVLPIVLVTATLPVLSRLWASDPRAFAETLRRTLTCVIALAVPIAVALFLLAEDVVGTLLTLRGYANTVPILRIEALLVPFLFVDYLLVCALMACGRERRWLAIVATACVLVPILDFVCIVAANDWTGNGGLGAALATLLVELAFLAATVRSLPARTLDRGAFGAAALAASLGIVDGATLVLARSAGVPWPVAATLGALVYAVGALRLGLVPPDIATAIEARYRAMLRRAPAHGDDAGGVKTPEQTRSMSAP